MITVSDGSLTVTVPIRINRRGSRKTVALPDGSAVQPVGRHADADPARAFRGHRWLAMVDKFAGSELGRRSRPRRGRAPDWGEQSGEARTLSEVAEREGMDRPM